MADLKFSTQHNCASDALSPLTAPDDGDGDVSNESRSYPAAHKKACRLVLQPSLQATPMNTQTKQSTTSNFEDSQVRFDESEDRDREAPPAYEAIAGPDDSVEQHTGDSIEYV